MNQLKIFVLYVISLIVIACSATIKSDSVNKQFYNELNEQVNSDYFSPLKFANHQIADTTDVNWELKDKSISISTSEGTTTVNFSPIQVTYSSEVSHSKSSYSFLIYNSNGTTSVIDALKDFEKHGEKVQFSTLDDNINIVVEPKKNYLKWKITPINKSLVDSIIIKSDSEGPFYGGGERYIGTKLNGRTISNQPNDHYWDPPRTEISPWGNPHEPGHYNKYEPTYLQLSYFLNTQGQAWLIDDAASVFMTFPKEGNAFSVRIESNQTEFYTIQRGTAKGALNTFTSLVGRQPALEDWAVGVWVCMLDGQDSVYAKANRLLDWKIPATAIWVYDMGDIPNSQGYENWTTGPYLNLRKMTDSLHNLGYKVLSYLHPYQEVKLPKSDADNPTYKTLDSLGILLVTPQNIRNSRYAHDTNGLYNFHLPLMGELWQNMLRNVIKRDGFDGYMEDFGDLSYCFDRKKQQWKAIDYGQETPLTANQYNNSYPLVYHKLSYLLAKEIDPKLATFCRSGSIGAAPYTKIIWGGDQLSNWDKTFGYPSVITSGISCGLSGYANWAPDILSSSTDMELWKRWVQFAAFTLIMRDHLWVNDPTSVDIWFNDETPQYFKRYAEVHMKLVPYIQEALAHYRETGTPLVRHMMLEFPEEPESFNCEYQYMFGSKYLVAPVVDKGATTKKIYFPKGEWKCFWNKDLIRSSGEWITVDAPLEDLPVYERLMDIHVEYINPKI
ncbi:TIM-barrel domain-containing protein [Polaribacter sp. SA4-12]|uniref:TIM-barrel domain-containing protein n=1 Tax=Polaribacter sp. SA4-12 TaxID=1312072 RepID=UPI000B3C3581|nr:TIM-barrel domain-containing protein [Polaribacter sp. SA4-12]ARV16548.1 hypothetical protein BTO07_16000 [Polaribacter sp. SA4-12]